MLVLDTVLFQHHTPTIPETATNEPIIHCLRSLTTAIWADRSPDQTNNQLLAIESLCAILALHAKAIDATPSGRDMPLLTVTSPAPLPRVIESVPASRVVEGAPAPKVDIDPAQIPRVTYNIPPAIIIPPSN